MKKSLLVFVAIFSLGFLNGCGSGPSTPPPPVATHFSVTPAANTATAGKAFNFTVTALDASNAAVPGYSGTAHFTSSDGQAALPADSSLTNGAGSYSATLKTAGGQTITATATIAGSSNAIMVSAATASQLTVSAPATATARATFSFTVSALDAYNNPATSYAGTVHFASSDAKAILPANAPLPGGAGNFFATTESSGNQNITATDTVMGSLSGKSATIATTAPATLAITSGAPPNGTVDQSYGGIRRKYYACASNGGCLPCTPFMAPNPGTCPQWPPCGSRPCISRVVFTGFTLAATGGVPPYGWNASGLPPGLSVTHETVEYDVAGTPPIGSNATYSGVQVTVNDSGNPPANLPATYKIVINNPPPPVVNANYPPYAGAINQPYNYQLLATSGALPYQNWKETGPLPAGMALSSGGVLSGTPTATGMFPISVTVQDAASQTSAAQAFTFSIYSHGFSATGSMSSVRSGDTATVLGNGKVLVAGGADATGKPLATAELFDPAAGTFSATSSMGTARANHTATLLKTGKVLVTGGTDGVGELATAELYDPATGKFTSTGSMGTARISHTATLLNSNKVLILTGTDANGNPLSSAELYDPAAGTFSSTGGLSTAREACAIALLNTGKVLVTGGGTGTSVSPLASSELYDPATGTFSATGSMASSRVHATATLLGTGKVLVAGGGGASGNAVAIAELYDPAAGTFAATGTMVNARANHTATVLNGGTVLLAGGLVLTGNFYTGLAAAEIFDPATGIFSATGSLTIDRRDHNASLLNDGKVLVSGGFHQLHSSYLETAELYE